MSNAACYEYLALIQVTLLLPFVVDEALFFCLVCWLQTPLLTF